MNRPRKRRAERELQTTAEKTRAKRICSPLRKGERRRAEPLCRGKTFSALITPDSCNLQVFGG